MVTPGQPPQQRPPMRPPVSQQQRMPAMSQAPGSIPQQIVNPAQARMQSPMMGNPGQNPNLMSQQQQMVSQHNPVSSQYQVSLISKFKEPFFYDFTYLVYLERYSFQIAYILLNKIVLSM